MSECLAHWLQTHEALIVRGWARCICEGDERLGTTFVVEAYRGLIEAARGDHAPLYDALSHACCLPGLAAPTLPQMLEIVFQLRRIVWEIGLQDDSPTDLLRVLAELEPLTEWMVSALSRKFGQEAERTASSQSRTILESIADGVVVYDCAGAIKLANGASARILERPLDEVTTANIHDLLHALKVIGPECDLLGDILAVPLEGQQQPHQFQTTFRIWSRSIELMLRPVQAESGELIGGVAVLHDLTREIEADRAKTEFIGSVSHELRTPMTVIQGYAQLLNMATTGDLTATQRQLLDTITINAKRMTSLIDDLLLITMIESGALELDLRPVDVGDVVRMALGEQKALLEARQHHLRIDVPPDLPRLIVDSKRMQQALCHLLSNAAKYTPKSGALSITAREINRSDLPPEYPARFNARRYVAIAVSDTGIGIAPEDHERIFERFYRIDSDLKVEAGGAGLGLSLVRPLVQLMGGHVWVDSSLNEGATFTVVLPAA